MNASNCQFPKLKAGSYALKYVTLLRLDYKLHVSGLLFPTIGFQRKKWLYLDCALPSAVDWQVVLGGRYPKPFSRGSFYNWVSTLRKI